MAQYSDRDEWESLPTDQRCRIVSGAAVMIAGAAEDLLRLSETDQRAGAVETISSELLPLCSAIRYIGRKGSSILRTRRHGWLGRPVWLWGVRGEVRREPYGTVLILGTWNYPLLLPGVQTAQALAAGNRVILKPAVGTESAAAALIDCFYQAGVPPGCLRQIDSSTQAAVDQIDSGVDLIVLTGAASTGRQVLRQAAESVTPTIMELSGCDALVVMPEALQNDVDLNRVAAAIRFGLTLNGGATCIAPRRLIVEDQSADKLLQRLRAELVTVPPAIVHPAARQATCQAIVQAIAEGAVDRFHTFDQQELETGGKLRPVVLDHVQPSHAIASADIFAPVTSVIRVGDIHDAVTIINECPYRLAASVFGRSDAAGRLASQLCVGSVAINDVIVPTADPRIPFGGQGQSGFGVTRGAEGLLAMTVPKVVSRRRGRFAPHLQPRQPSDAETLLGVLNLCHGGSLAERFGGLRRIVTAGRHTSQSTTQNEAISINQGSQS